VGLHESPLRTKSREEFSGELLELLENDRWRTNRNQIDVLAPSLLLCREWSAR